MIGTIVNSYRITAKVSIGGMGTVYKAEHTLIGKHAAVKVLHPELRNNRDVVQRFFNEAKATTQIKHPGIVEMFDFGYLPNGDGFIVMEFLEGMSLAQRLKRHGKMREGEAALLMRGVCSALNAAHAMGIVHRDLKPDNIFLCPDPDGPTGDRPKILDFGIAKLNVGLTGPGNTTKTGAVMGTPTYMSPEQCKGTGEVDHRADLYSIGCMFYELVAGRPPFTNMGAGELIGAHLYVDPVSPNKSGAKMTGAAERLTMALLSKNPDKRPQTAKELGQLFAQLAQGAGLITRATPASIPTVTSGDDDSVDVVLTTPNRHSAKHVAATNAATMSRADTEAEPTMSTQPTTLSGAASQSVMRTPRSRVGLVAGVLFAGAATAAAVMFTMKDDAKPAPASSTSPTPTPTIPTPTVPGRISPSPLGAPMEAVEPVAQPAPSVHPTDPAMPVATPEGSNAESAAVPAAPTAKPGTKRAKPAKPTVPTTKPTTPTTNPTTPATKPEPIQKPKPADGSGSGKILIETDI